MSGLAGCDTASQSFSLPTGDEAQGKAVFLKYQCLACHSMTGFEDEASKLTRALDTPVVLGGEVSRIRTYPELVTSVINPSHRLAEGYDDQEIQVDGQSVMPSFNDVMTVTEMVNLVYFLESHYSLEPYPRTDYISPH
ncbi:c-type cytochrome [Photobacterium galatheae]|nr:c-type cytochrome [Photobacterium galatheae]